MDTAIGFILIGVVMLVVLGAVFVISTRGGRRTAPAHGGPPPGVHMPLPSMLPVIVSFGMALIGAGLAFRGEDQIANPFIVFPGIAVVILAIIAWVRAANREWREVDHGSHEDGASH
jgi:hypothetical protein